ncbi:MAG: putative heme-binding domain-containing protein [Akkermansiaceae bacterium]|jgi:putative heme-binding domain-containing protein
MLCAWAKNDLIPSPLEGTIASPRKSVSKPMKSSLLSLFLVAPALAMPDGYEISNWAEPFDIEYPTAITAAADGTVYVSVDKNGSIGKDKNMGKVVSCCDTNGDGKADKFVDFVPNVDSPRGGHFVRDTLYLIHPPFLSAFRDTTGDGVADEHKVLLENIGFGLRHPRGADHTTNGCRMGIDGWIYIAVGDFGMEGTKGTDGKVVTFRGGGVARVRPDGSDLEVYSYHTRNICDVAISPKMDLFTRDNTNDGKGWNIRIHHLSNGSEHGYPRLYKNFPDETLKPMLDLGGGSGTGALYLAEPGHEEMLLTCDWTTGKIYREELTEKGASFSVKESVFMDLTRAVDIDVDGEGNLYVCDWRNGRFRFAGEGKKIGMVQKLTKKGLKSEPFPDLAKMELAKLVEQLKSKSGVRRLEAQREILARGGKEAFVGLREIALNGNSIESRAAAIFTFAQLEGITADVLMGHFMGPWVGMPWLHEFVLRAASDLGGELKDSTKDLVADALNSMNPRTQLQAIVALMRIKNPGDEASDLILKAATVAKDPRIENTALRALVTLEDTESLLRHLDHRLARLALMRIHKPEVVSGVVVKLEQASGVERMELIKILARLFHGEEKWDLKAWWGTRPDDRGPYFAPVTWEETGNITAALEGVFEKLAKKEQEEMLAILGKNRVPVSKLKLGDQDPFTLALVAATPSETQINLLTEVAKDGERSWEQRLKGYRGLGRMEWQTVRKQVEVLGAWIDQKVKQEDLDRELGDFVNQPTLIMSINPLREIAVKGSKSESRVAWRSLLTITHSPLIKEKWKTAIQKMIDKNPREEGFFRALSDLILPGFDQQIESAIDSDNDTLIEAAKHAKKVIAAAKASAGKRVAELKSVDVMKLAMTSKGDAVRGQKVYTRQGCIVCHAVDQKAVQKGPYLGSAGSKFTKDYLVQSILDPNAVVAQGFQTELITMKDQSVHMGFVTREEDGVVDVRNIAGVVTQIKEDEIQKRDHQPQSMMPAGLAATLTLDEFNDLIAYLSSMKD